MSQGQDRKKNFSISMKPREISEVDKYIEELIVDSGFKVTRNEIIRRATLAHVRFMKNKNKDYKEIFKGVGI